MLRRAVLAPLVPVLLLLACPAWRLVLVDSVLLCPLLAAMRRDRPRARTLRVSSMALDLALVSVLGKDRCRVATSVGAS